MAIFSDTTCAKPPPVGGISRRCPAKPALLAAGLTAVFTAFGAKVHADEAGKATSSLPTIVITSQLDAKRRQTDEVNLELHTGLVNQIDYGQLEGKVESVSEVIAKQAGVQIRQVGGLGDFSEISIRGSTSEQVGVYLDGMPLNSSLGGGVNLGNLAISDLDSIEIFQGIAPINFGQASIGGVVNLKTRRFQDRPVSNVTLGYGSYSTKAASAFTSRAFGSWEILANAGYLESDNDYQYKNESGTLFANTQDDNWERRNNSEFDQKNALLKTAYQINPRNRLDLLYQYFDKRQNIPNWLNSPEIDASLDTRQDNAQLKLTADRILDSAVSSSLRFNYTDKQESFYDPQGSVSLTAQNTDEDTTSHGLNWYSQWEQPDQQWTSDIEIREEKYDHREKTQALNFGTQSRRLATAALQDSLFLAHEKLIVTPGVRYNTSDSHYRESESNNTDQSYWDYQLGAKYALSNDFLLMANWAKYHREPSFYELFGERGLFHGNPELVPEKGRILDAGFELKQRGSNVGWFLLWRLTYFQSQIDDEITRVYDARGVGTAINNPGSEIRGVESHISGNFARYYSLSFNATWQDTRNKSDNPIIDGKQLPGRYETFWFLRLDADVSRLNLFAEYQRQDNMYYDSANLLKADDKQIVNLGLKYLYRALHTRLEVKNVFNNRFNDYYRQAQASGTAYFASVKVDF